MELVVVAVVAGAAGAGVWWFTHIRGWASSDDVIAVVVEAAAGVLTLGVPWA